MESTSGRGLPVLTPSAINAAQTDATGRSTTRVRPANQTSSSRRSQSPNSVRRRPGVSNSIPFSISARVITLTYCTERDVDSTQLRTPRSGPATRLYSDSTLVSSRYPVIPGEWIAAVPGTAPDQAQNQRTANSAVAQTDCETAPPQPGIHRRMRQGPWPELPARARAMRDLGTRHEPQYLAQSQDLR